MHPNNILAISLLVALTACGVWDVFAISYLGPGTTVSAVVHSWARSFPMLGVAVGALIGHLFWPVDGGRG